MAQRPTLTGADINWN